MPMFFKNEEGKGQIETLPLLPLRDVVIFPYMVAPLFVGREKSIRALEEAMKKNKEIRVPAQLKPGDTVGIVAPAGSFDLEAFSRGLEARGVPALAGRSAVLTVPTGHGLNRRDALALLGTLRTIQGPGAEGVDPVVYTRTLAGHKP